MAMVVGLPKEIKENEHRVALTPDNIRVLVSRGRPCVVEASAGLGSGFTDQEYIKAGAKVVGTHADVFNEAELIVKVKEPLSPEWPLLKPHHTLFTYLHLASGKELTEALAATGATCIAYECVETKDGYLPVLAPMSEVAGRLSIQMGTHFLEKHNGGSGVLMAGVPGVKPGVVVVIGAGVAGTNAALIAAGLGARVILMDNNIQRLRALSVTMPPNVETVYSTPTAIEQALKEADIGVGAALVPGGRTPVLISKDMLMSMKPGSIFVDIAIDQGGLTTESRPTTHSNPIIMVGSTLLYCVANMPGCVPRTSTLAISNATLPYVMELATKGTAQALATNTELLKGLSIAAGKVTYKRVADLFGMDFLEPTVAVPMKEPSAPIIYASNVMAPPSTASPPSINGHHSAATNGSGNGNGAHVARCFGGHAGAEGPMVSCLPPQAIWTMRVPMVAPQAVAPAMARRPLATKAACGHAMLAARALV